MKKNYVYWVLALIFICIPELKARADRYKEQPKEEWNYNFETAKADNLGDRPNHYDLKLNGLAWSMYAVRCSGGPNDFANGKYSARIYGSKMSMKEMPYMTMTDDQEHGIGSVEFNYRAYGEHTTSQVTWCVQLSEDKGAHWETIGRPFTPTEKVQHFRAEANSGVGRIRIVRADYAVFDCKTAKSFDAAFNLDDLKMTYYNSEAPQRPSIAVENTLLEFGDVNKNDAKTQRVNIVYSGLTTNVALSVVGDDASAFSLSTNQIEISEDGGKANFDVTYIPQTLGEHQAVLKMQSGDIETEVYLTGKGVRKQGEYTYSGGEGTKDNPYLISTASDIEDLSFAVDTETDYAGKYFKLTTDIDMTGINNMKPIGNNFGTEGTKLKAFSGTFDGNKHKISNLNMIYKGKNNIGVALFGILKDAKVMNLTLTNAHFEADAIVASIASVLVASVLQNCHTGENVTVKARLKPYAGGIATSTFLSPSFISNCTSRTKVEATDMAVGGILGMSSIQGTSIKNCINYGNINTNSNVAGGIVGYVETGSLSISDCLNAGDINAENIAGGLFGTGLQGSNITINNSYNIGRVGIIEPNGAADPIFPIAAMADGVIVDVGNCYYDNALYRGNSYGIAYPKDDMRSQEFTDRLNADRAVCIWKRLVGVNNELPVPCGEGEVITHITQTVDLVKPLLHVVDGRIVAPNNFRIKTIHNMAGYNYNTSDQLPTGVYIVTLLSNKSIKPIIQKVRVVNNFKNN